MVAEGASERDSARGTARSEESWSWNAVRGYREELEHEGGERRLRKTR